VKSDQNKHREFCEKVQAEFGEKKGRKKVTQRRKGGGTENTERREWKEVKDQEMSKEKRREKKREKKREERCCSSIKSICETY